jgi:hypothetical protein
VGRQHAVVEDEIDARAWRHGREFLEQLKGFEETAPLPIDPIERVVERPRYLWYFICMKSNTKSSITLPPEELQLVILLQARLKAKSKVEVVRRGLRLLQETTDRKRLREAYRRASLATRASLSKELKDLDPLVGDGLEER